jgi:hypothetical protein
LSEGTVNEQREKNEKKEEKKERKGERGTNVGNKNLANDLVSTKGCHVLLNINEPLLSLHLFIFGIKRDIKR